MTCLPLSKTLDPADFDQLTEELQVVDRHFRSEREQHQMRRWEYALALHAIARWRGKRDYRYPRGVMDVGGAGSPFWRMVNAQATTQHVQVIDPAENCTLEAYLTDLGSDPKLHDVVTCISVLEHIADLDRFCYHLSCLVAPGGLLFLTFDYCNDPVLDWPEDHYHFSWMRKRIFNEWARGGLHAKFARRDFEILGAISGQENGPHVYDYSFASLALIKRP